MVGELARKVGFWTLDTLRGKPVGIHYQDIKEIFEDSNIAEKRRAQYLCRLLEHAAQTVEFYKPYSTDLNLTSFPVVNKILFRENIDRFLSSTYKDKKLHYMSTSGSTGIPFVFPQDMNKRSRVLAELIYFGKLCGFDLGMRNIYFRLWNEGMKKSSLTAFMQNMVKMRTEKLDEEELEKMREVLKSDQKIQCIMGYSSTLKFLAKYMLEHGDHPEMFNVKTIITLAEKLPGDVRKDLEKLFNCSVVARYSNMENGVLAQECTSKSEYHMNHASYIFELLKMDSDEPAEEGEVGRIVITDLFNYVMPLIRYDIGDLGAWGIEAKCGMKTPVFKSVDGRFVDLLYDTKDRPISPQSEYGLELFEKIEQYQVIQEGRKQYRLRVNVKSGIYTDEEIRAAMSRIFGEDAEITIQYVDEIPVLSSGKYKFSICNYKPSFRYE